MEKKRLRRTCQERCGQVFNVRREGDEEYDGYTNTGRRMIAWQPDPYAEEIYGDFTCMWICDYCAYQSYMDV